MVRELTKAEQARGALIGTPGSVHTRHGSEPKQYGPGFFGSRRWKALFWLGTLLTFAVFAGFIVWEESHAPAHSEEEGEEPLVPGSEEAEESFDTSGVSLGPLSPASTVLLSTALPSAA